MNKLWPIEDIVFLFIMLRTNFNFNIYIWNLYFYTVGEYCAVHIIFFIKKYFDALVHRSSNIICCSWYNKMSKAIWKVRLNKNTNRNMLSISTFLALSNRTHRFFIISLHLSSFASQCQWYHYSHNSAIIKCRKQYQR